MAKLILVSADDARARQMLALAQQAGTRRQPQLVCLDPAKALAAPGLIHATDFVVLQAEEFDMDVLERLRQRFPEPGDVPCILVTPQPSAELLMRAMRMGVRSVLRWPLDPREFGDELARLDTRAEAETSAQARTFAFTSCKGGRGTTFAAANFAYAVAAQRGKRVLLVDLDQQFGDAAFVVTDKIPPATLGDICHQIDRLDAALLDACVTHAHPNLDVIAGAGDPVKASDVKAAHLERILDLARPTYDVLVFRRLAAGVGSAELFTDEAAGTLAVARQVLDAIDTSPVGFVRFDRVLLTVHPAECQVREFFIARLAQTARAAPDARV
ncbi:MAG: AAA family ATPase, partial [Cupriavidus sp.]|nr:AAA family ATPase [Cupriavidus sp.]